MSSSSLRRGQTFVAVAYVAALAAGWAAHELGPFTHPFWRVAFADAVGTCVVFAFSRAFDNSSFYDAYWSVAPIVFVWVWALASPSITPRAWLVIALVSTWGVRLTFNWARHWRGLDHEDWRYVALRDKTGPRYWLVSFFGLHFFPTVMVLACCPAIFLAATSTRPLGALDAAALLVTAGAILIEATADRQLHDFAAGRPDPASIMTTGLWSWSRHPNYFGEVSFWWGLFVFGLAAEPNAWWAATGPLALTAMFLFVSIPMLERRMIAKRPHYREHQKRVSRLIPLPPAR